jgi:predicted nuclease of predicted toxin-antitoxin system
MRILLDENLDRRLKQGFHPMIEVETVAERGWNGKKNGELLTLAAVDFDAFVTADQILEMQQNIAN